MPRLVRVRALQAVLAAAYLLLAAVAVARLRTPLVVVFAAAMTIGAYLTGRTVPDVYVRREAILQVCGVGLLIIIFGIAADVTGGSRALEWASIAMAYCAGNRLRAAGCGLRAAGVGPAS